jgi:class 3 adenylate cyclase
MNLENTGSQITQAEETTRSKNRRLLYIIMPSIWFLFTVTLIFQFNSEIKTLKTLYIKHESEKTLEIKNNLEDQFYQVYHSLRTLSRLPAVRKIDRYAKNFNEDGKKVFQELYNNLYNDFRVSEVYIVPDGMEPDKIDPHTHKLQEPITTFDKFIVGAINNNEEHADKNIKKVEEVEIFEYREMKRQLAWFKKYYPFEKSIKGLNYPSLFSHEVITCDNSFIDPTNVINDDRRGMIYSVPFYSETGAFKGLVSAVFLTKVLKDLLPDDFYILSNTLYHFDLKSIKWADPLAILTIPALTSSFKKTSIDELIFSKFYSLNFYERNPSWVLWSGQPDETFWKSALVKKAKIIFGLSALAITLIVLGLYFLIIWVSKKDHDEMKNILVKFHGIAVAESIISRTISVGGKTRETVVFFSDIRGFSTYTEKNSPQEVVQMLNEYFSLMVDIVEKHHGIVDKFIGDSIMAVWGAPKRKTDDVTNAIMSCLNMRKALSELNVKRAKKNLFPLKIGMGLHFGYVVSGIIGSEKRMEYTVIGNAVNVASRIESITKDYDTDLLVSQEIVDKALGKFIFEIAGTAEVRGIEKPVNLYKVNGYFNGVGLKILN